MIFHYSTVLKHTTANLSIKGLHLKHHELEHQGVLHLPAGLRQGPCTAARHVQHASAAALCPALPPQLVRRVSLNTYLSSV